MAALEKSFTMYFTVRFIPSWSKYFNIKTYNIRILLPVMPMKEVTVVGSWYLVKSGSCADPYGIVHANSSSAYT